MFAALPLWFWWFQSRIIDHLPDYAKKRARRYMLIGIVWVGLTIWLVWSFVLPDWWIAATPLVTEE
jgi:polyferredoxin